MSKLLKKNELKPNSSIEKKPMRFTVTLQHKTSSIEKAPLKPFTIDQNLENLNASSKEITQPHYKHTKDEIKHLAKERFYNSILQSLIKIIETPFMTLKVFVLIYILILTALSSYSVVETFLAFYAYEVTSTSRTLYEIPAQFPKVTICNCNITFNLLYCFYSVLRLCLNCPA